jgi:hypothetical protein
MELSSQLWSLPKGLVQLLGLSSLPEVVVQPVKPSVVTAARHRHSSPFGNRAPQDGAYRSGRVVASLTNNRFAIAPVAAINGPSSTIDPQLRNMISQMASRAPCHFVGWRVAVIDHLPPVAALIQKLTQK